MDPQEALRLAREALAQGEDAKYVDSQVAELTQFPNLFALRMAVEGHQDAATAETANRITERGHSATSDFARMLTQGATFGFADEIVGAVAGPEARDASRARVADLREVHPGASLASEVAGGFLLPGAGARTAVATGGRTARAVGRGAAVGGLLGAAGAGTYAVGEAEGTAPERLQEAKAPAAFGGLLGAVTGGAGAGLGSVVRRGAASRGDRVGAQLRGLAETGGGIAARRGRVAGVREAVRRSIYRPLERQHTAVEDEAVNAVLDQIATDTSTRGVLRKLGLVEPRAPKAPPGQGPLPPARTRAPSFADLDTARRELVEKGRRGNIVAEGLAEELDAAMADAFGESYARARQVWGRTQRHLDQLDDGWRMWNKREAEIRDHLRGMTPERARVFNQGRISRLDAELRRGDDRAASILKEIVEGSDPRASLRLAFPDDRTFNEFLRIARSEKSLTNVVGAYKALARPLAAGVGAGAGYQAATSLFSN